MFTYTAILVACLVVSAVVFFLYRVISDSSRSVYSSREHMTLYDDVPKRHQSPLGGAGAAHSATAFGSSGGHSTPRNFASTFPAKPAESVNWGWEGSGVQLNEPQFQPGPGAGRSDHCSLFDVNATGPNPGVRPNPYTGKLHREEVNKATGRTYKVTRKTRATNVDDADLHKPWGW